MLESSSIGKPRVTESMCTESVAGSEPTLVTTLLFLRETLGQRHDMTEKNQRTRDKNAPRTYTPCSQTRNVSICAHACLRCLQQGITV